MRKCRFGGNGVGHHGSIALSVKREGDYCHCFICDTGIGIDPEDQKRLFNKFVQADGSLTRKYGGTDLGLAISRAIMEQMGGWVNLYSGGIGQGTTVEVVIPLTLKN